MERSVKAPLFWYKILLMQMITLVGVIHTDIDEDMCTRVTWFHCNLHSKKGRDASELIQWNENVMLMKFLTLAAPEVDIPGRDVTQLPWEQDSWDQHGAHLGLRGPRWAPCWPHELSYLGTYSSKVPYVDDICQRHVLMNREDLP